MLKVRHPVPRDMLFGFDPDDGDAGYHVAQVVRHLPSETLSGLIEDINLYERTGEIVDGIRDLLRRAACHADAERIGAKF